MEIRHRESTDRRDYLRHAISLGVLALPASLTYVIITLMGVVTGWRLGLTGTVATLVPALLLLPTALRPWLVRIVHVTGFSWLNILGLQLLMAICVGGTAFALNMRSWRVVAITLLSIASVTVAIYGAIVNAYAVRMGKVTGRQTVMFVRVLMYVVALYVVLGLLVVMAGNLEVLTRRMRYSWSFVYYVAAGVLLLLMLLNAFLLPRKIFQPLQTPVAARMKPRPAESLFHFMVLLPESMLAVGLLVWLLSSKRAGGLNLSPQEIGYCLGSIGLMGVATGVVLGMIALRRWPVRKVILPALLLLILPDLLFVYISSAAMPTLLAVNAIVLVKQTGLGLGIIMLIGIFSALSERGVAVGWLFPSAVLAVSAGCVLAGVLPTVMGFHGYFILVTCLGALPVGMCLWKLKAG